MRAIPILFLVTCSVLLAEDSIVDMKQTIEQNEELAKMASEIIAGHKDYEAINKDQPVTAERAELLKEIAAAEAAFKDAKVKGIRVDQLEVNTHADNAKRILEKIFEKLNHGTDGQEFEGKLGVWKRMRAENPKLKITKEFQGLIAAVDKIAANPKIPSVEVEKLMKPKQ